jgi:hydroxymethylpyrimidine/phosphomethylpyrimidine kinase
VALSIAATDSGGGAGLAADLRTFAALGVFGAFVVTGVSAQNSVEVKDFLAIQPSLVATQLDAVISDLPIAAAKTGMLPSSDIVQLLAARGRSGRLPPLVVDPVLVSSTGEPLFPGDELAASYRELIAHATVVTPNTLEATMLTGHSVMSLEEMELAARELQAAGPRLAVVKGGRRPGPEAVDVAFDGRCVTLLRSLWTETPNVHGSGCTFSAAIAAYIALGLEPLQAAIQAKQFVSRAIKGGACWRLGAGQGPLDQMGAAPDPAKA